MTTPTPPSDAAREAIHKCAIVPLKHRRIRGYAVQIGGVGGGGVPLGALQLIDLWEAFDALRGQVAALEKRNELMATALRDVDHNLQLEEWSLVSQNDIDAAREAARAAALEPEPETGG